jgi:hypothetical protein
MGHPSKVNTWLLVQMITEVYLQKGAIYTRKTDQVVRSVVFTSGAHPSDMGLESEGRCSGAE